MSLEELDKTIDLTRRCMSLIGVWPESNKNTKSSLKFLISIFLVLFFIMIPQTIKLYFVTNNLNNVIEVLSYVYLPAIISLCKFYNGWVKKNGKI